MTELEQQVAELRAQLDRLAERVRLDAVAKAFLRGYHEIRQGDCFLMNGHFPTKLSNVSSQGKWTYFDGSHVVEFGRTEPADHDRLYTIAEVAEIVANLQRGKTDG